jgi:hypothetical protein
MFNSIMGAVGDIGAGIATGGTSLAAKGLTKKAGA